MCRRRWQAHLKDRPPPTEHSRDQYIRAGDWPNATVLAKVSGQQSCRIHKVGVHAGERSHEAADRDQRKRMKWKNSPANKAGVMTERSFP